MRLWYHIVMETKRQAGRINQKRRTRAALVSAAVELVDAGQVPTIPEVADHAGISRATAYRYFSSQEGLLIEAVLEQALPEIEEVVSGWSAADDVEARIGQLVEVVLRTVVEHETTFRAMLGASLQLDSTEDPARGGRRLRWIREAIAPAAGELSEAEIEDLVATLTPFFGIEALVAYCDVAGLDRKRAIAASRRACLAILRGTVSGA